MNKIKTTTGIALVALFSFSLYGSYKFYSKSVKTTEIIVDTLNIDSLKSRYELQIQKLEDKIAATEEDLNQKRNEISSMRKYFDSVNNKLWFYKSRLKSDTIK